MERENSFDTFVVDNAADGEVFVYAPALAGNYGACEYLSSLFVAFSNTTVDVDDIAYLKVRNFFL